MIITKKGDLPDPVLTSKHSCIGVLGFKVKISSVQQAPVLKRLDQDQHPRILKHYISKSRVSQC